MSDILVDTDVFSYAFKRSPLAVPYLPDLAGHRNCVCFQTVAEVRRWALEKVWGAKRRADLEAKLRGTIVIGYNDALANEWALINALRSKAGRRIECGDAWIAAAALLHRLPLFTHNASHFQGIPGLTVVSH